eukprot:GHUV01032567.1.p1 GENE.GHUV01032567.1~~GHUV01032567.1.p1  ORF type:complete len:133 (-),score=21.09 GHUV01032567.1:1107-1505(-)
MQMLLTAFRSTQKLAGINSLSDTAALLTSDTGHPNYMYMIFPYKKMQSPNWHQSWMHAILIMSDRTQRFHGNNFQYVSNPQLGHAHDGQRYPVTACTRGYSLHTATSMLHCFVQTTQMMQQALVTADPHDCQ